MCQDLQVRILWSVVEKAVIHCPKSRNGGGKPLGRSLYKSVAADLNLSLMRQTSQLKIRHSKSKDLF